MYQQFNVNLYHPPALPDVGSLYARTYNSLMQALNEEVHLPAILIINVEWSCLKDLNFFKFGVSKLIGKMINWLVDNVNGEIEVRRAHLKKVLPGAVIHGEPSILWVKAFNRPCKDQSLSLRSKLNAVLEETLTKHRQNFICDINRAFQGINAAFDRSGMLTPTGKIAFWNEIDDIVKRFDREPTKFKPFPVISNPPLKKRVPDPDRYHLPPPPQHPQDSTQDPRKAILILRAHRLRDIKIYIHIRCPYSL